MVSFEKIDREAAFWSQVNKEGPTQRHMPRHRQHHRWRCILKPIDWMERAMRGEAAAACLSPVTVSPLSPGLKPAWDAARDTCARDTCARAIRSLPDTRGDK